MPAGSLDPEVRGAREALQWALGRQHDAPVTRADPLGERPTPAQLDGERRAAWHAADDILAGRTHRRRALGAARTLTWLLDASAAPP
ncbi:hypothetical protein [Kitasatospora purpeofusca]|uniref:hypothetical protein n=1 Tax=Kitasatospora purpeofusca TaxID=67352 RepID=UPI0035D56CED